MKFISYSKWILCGEHAVLRGHPAIVFPLKNFFCRLTYNRHQTLSVIYENESDEYVEIFIQLLRRACDFLRIDFKKLKGKFSIFNNIPMASGFGSSAAICANIAKFFIKIGWCADFFPLARYLEDTFHGTSSGMDVLASISEHPILFQNGQIIEVLDDIFMPEFVLVDLGIRSSTAECIKKIKQLWEKDPILGKKLDQQMHKATDLCLQALKTGNFDLIAEAFELAQSVYEQWGDNSKYFKIANNSNLSLPQTNI